MNPLDLRNLSYALHHPAEFSPAQTWAAVVKCFHIRECGSGNVDACLTGGYGIERPRPTAALSTLPAPVCAGQPMTNAKATIIDSAHRVERGYVDPLILWTLVLLTGAGLVICWQLKRLTH